MSIRGATSSGAPRLPTDGQSVAQLSMAYENAPVVTKVASCCSVIRRPSVSNHTTNLQPSFHRSHPQPRWPVMRWPILQRGQTSARTSIGFAAFAARFFFGFVLAGAVAVPAAVAVVRERAARRGFLPYFVGDDGANDGN